MKFITIGMIISTAACTVSSQMLLKGVSGHVSQVIPELSFSNVLQLILFSLTEPKILVAVALQALGFGIWIVVLSREHAGVALGLGGASVYLLTALVEKALFGVTLSGLQITGLILLSIGALFLTNLNVS